MGEFSLPQRLGLLLRIHKQFLLIQIIQLRSRKSGKYGLDQDIPEFNLLQIVGSPVSRGSLSPQPGASIRILVLLLPERKFGIHELSTARSLRRQHLCVDLFLDSQHSNTHSAVRSDPNKCTIIGHHIHGAGLVPNADHSNSVPVSKLRC